MVKGKQQPRRSTGAVKLLVNTAVPVVRRPTLQSAPASEPSDVEIADGSSSTEDDDTDVVSYPQLRISSLQLNHYSGVGCVEMVGRLQFAMRKCYLHRMHSHPRSILG